MIDPRYDTQLLIEGEGLDEDAIREHITQTFNGDSLVLAGDDELIKLHFIPTLHGKYWNMPQPWAKFMTSS